MRRVLLLWALLLTDVVRAQQLQTIFETVRLENGSALTSAPVYAVAEDTTGFLWFGSDNGLFRYDGYAATPFHFDAADSTSLSDDRVRALFTDRRGQLWVGTQNGLNRYDPLTRCFRRFRAVADWVIYNLWESADGTFWATARQGLFRYLPEREAFEPLPLHYADGRPVKSAVWFIKDGKGNTWAIVDESPVSVNLQDGTVTPIVLPEAIFDKSREFHRLYADSKNRLWLMGWPGALVYDPADGSCRRLPLPDSLGYRLSRCMAEDAAGHIWLTFRFDGMVRWDDQLQEAMVFTNSATNPFSLSTKRVFDLYLDRRQTLWLGTFKGVQKCRISNPFQFYQPVPGYADDNVMFSIGADARGGIWMGTAERGLHSPRLGAKPEAIPINPEARRGEMRIKDANRFFRDHAGALWMATGRGLHRALPGDALEPLHISDQLDRQSVYDLLADPDQPDYLWVLSVHGLLRLHRSKLSDTSWHIPPRPVLVRNASALALDDRGNIWLTLQGGLGFFQRKTGQFRVFHAAPGGLLSNEITCLAAGGPGNLWIGTPQGLSRLDFSAAAFDGPAPPDTARFLFQNYTVSDGLPDNRILSLALDAAGRVWFTTLSALCCIDPADNSLRQFPVGSHPVSGFERNATSWLDGRLAVGGLNGFWLFEPAAIRQDSSPVPLVLTDFKINNLPYALPQPPEWSREIVLGQQQNVFSFQWAGLNPVAPEGLRYTCRLEGYDPDWSPLSTSRYATYTNVPPGVYYFRVKTLNADGVWSSRELNLKIVIMPAWWQTGWFRALLALLAAVIGYFIWENSRQKRHLREQKNLAEQNARYKSRFLANVSHEIRTPMNAIVGLNKLLLDTSLDGKQHEYVVAIQQSSENLLWLVNDILDQAKIESGHYTFARRDFDLGMILQQLNNTFLYRAREKNLAFDVVCPPGVPLHLTGDPIRLFQILTNLTGNALKFTERGWVQVRISRLDTGSDPEQTELQFEVADSGIGIPPGRLDEIFESFHQLDDDPTTAAQQGTGLGLSITKELVEQQGGTLSVESTAGQGSTFRVRLRFGVAAAAAGPQLASDPPQLTGLRILLVEDTPFNQLLALDLLKKHIAEAQVDLAENGQIALDKVRQHAYDLVLMDVKMPILDGYAATRAIRALPGEATRRVPIIGLTANAIAEQIIRCKEAGMDDVVTKPIEAAELMEKIARYTRKG